MHTGEQEDPGQGERRSDRDVPGPVDQLDLVLTDPEGQPLRTEWRLLKESQAQQVGGDAEEIPDELDRHVLEINPATAEVLAPRTPGAYRLFVYAYDNAGAMAHANIPFLVR